MSNRTWEVRILSMFAAAVFACAFGAGCATCPPEDQAAVDGLAEREVPEVVRELETQAVETYNTVKAGNWQEARDDVAWFEDALRRVDREVKGEPTLREDLQDAVVNLRRAVANEDRANAMAYANRISRIAGYMRAPMEARVPASVTLLDYYGRELELWSMAGNNEMLQVSARGLAGVWGNLRPLVVTEGGQDAAQRFDAAVSQVAAAQTPEQYAQAVGAVQSGAESVEQVFTR